MLNKETLGSLWSDQEFIVLDLEGTGAQHKEKEGIVDIAAVLIKDGMVTDKSYKQLINPGVKIPHFISKIHGIRNKDVEDKPVFKDIQEELEAFLSNRIMIAHNAKVDLRVLRYKSCKYEPPVVLDTLKMSRALYEGYSKHGLDQIIERFDLDSMLIDIPAEYKRHGAFYDAMTTAYAFVYMISDKLSKPTLDDLISLCAIESHIEEKINDLPKNIPPKYQQDTFF